MLLVKWIWILTFWGTMFWGCNDSGLDSGKKEPFTSGELNIVLNAKTVSNEIMSLKKTAANPWEQVDSIHFVVSSSSYSLSFGFQKNADNYKLPNIPPHTQVLVEVFVYGLNKQLLFTGSKPGVHVVEGQSTNLSLICIPELSSLNIVFPLGVGNPSQIAKGVFRLIHGTETKSDSIEIIGETGFFEFPNIMGNRKYAIEMSVALANGTEIFRNLAADSLYIEKGKAQQLSLSFQASLGSSLVQVQLQEKPQISATLRPKNALRRSPAAGEILFTEIFPAPTSSQHGSLGEWLEIYNRTHDTLILDSCRLAKTRTSTGSSTLFELSGTSPLSIGPGQALVFGADSVKFRDVLSPFRMVDTKQSVLLFCKEGASETLLDSIAYSNSETVSDSIYIETGKSSSLRLSKLGQPSLKGNWCLSGIWNPIMGMDSLMTPGHLGKSCL